MKPIFAVILMLCFAGCASMYDMEMDESAASTSASVASVAAASNADDGAPALFEKPLPWPVAEGTVIKTFGENIHPSLGTVTTNPGIDIAVSYGSPVKSVAPGRVALIESIAGYGKIVIVEHANAVFSVYAHLSEIRFSKGDEVAAEQVIATSGQNSDGPLLHFELWHQRQKQDPLLLLAQR